MEAASTPASPLERRIEELQLGIFLGTGVKILDTYGMEKVNLFGGIQGVDFFDDRRIIVGLRRMR